LSKSARARSARTTQFSRSLVGYVRLNLGTLTSAFRENADQYHEEVKLMRPTILLGAVVALLLIVSVPAVFAAGGFDEFGYNYQARNFVGPADGVDRVLDGKVWGDPTYANDHLKMKWSTAWDDARFHGAAWTPEAWCDNQWNGMVPGGSGETWHYRIVWVGPELEASAYWREGGYAIWGQFEVIMSHGVAAGQHIWEALATPAGYGGPY